jgi:peptidoglycan/xylan/chitin deacetylase (PgdA/CDA1 family)
MRVGGVAAMAAAFVASALPAPATGAGVTSLPPAVRATSLRQDGRNLVWSVSLSEKFASFKVLKRRHQSVCLLLKRPLAAQICATYSRSGPRLLYSSVGPHHHRHFQAVPGTITRPDPRTLRAIFLPTGAHISYQATLRWQTQAMVRKPACAPPPRVPNRCVNRQPRKPGLLRLHIPVPVGCVATGPKWVFHGPSSGRMIALTFDDGPWYDTPQFLHVLETKHVVATFFQIGDQISRYGGPGGAIEKRMLHDGDMIGDHSWSHPNLSSDGSFAYNQIRSTALAIQRATGGFYPCLFRAPYGATSQALLNEARRMGFTTIQWDVDPRDWSLPGTQAIYSNVVNNAHPGAIVIQHDGGGPRGETLAALPHEIDTLRARGYHFVTVAQLLGYRLIYK